MNKFIPEKYLFIFFNKEKTETFIFIFKKCKRPIHLIESVSDRSVKALKMITDAIILVTSQIRDNESTPNIWIDVWADRYVKQTIPLVEVPHCCSKPYHCVEEINHLIYYNNYSKFE